MANRPRAHAGPREKQLMDRRTAAGRGALGTLRRLKSLFVRPLKLERRGRQLRVVLVERRRAQAVDQPLSLSQMRSELHARLITQEYDPAGRVMRHLGLVHDELGRKGWAGVAAMPSRVIARALLQAELLAEQEPMPSLAIVIERLRVVKVAADLREERGSQLRDLPNGTTLEVSEATQEEFEESERSWAGSVPAAEELPGRDK